jgi:hypothetical protein
VKSSSGLIVDEELGDAAELVHMLNAFEVR